MFRSRVLVVFLAIALGACGGTAPRTPEDSGPPTPPENPAALEPTPSARPEPGPSAPPPSPAAISPRAIAIKERMSPVPDWACLEAGNFLILHSTKVKPEDIREIAGSLRLLLKVLAADYPMDGLEETLFVVRICKDESQFSQYGGPGSSTGYWSGYERELVSYVDETDRKRSIRRIPGILVLAYFSEALGFVAPHEWFSLGLSSFYSACELDRTGNLVPKKHVDFESTVRKAREGGTCVPLDQFLRYGRAQFLGPTIFDNYAQAWSFVWFLKLQKDPEWKGILSSYYEALGKGVREFRSRGEPMGGAGYVPPDEEERIRKSAWEAVFGTFDGEKWKRLERAWLDFK